MRPFAVITAATCSCVYLSTAVQYGLIGPRNLKTSIDFVEEWHRQLQSSAPIY